MNLTAVVKRLFAMSSNTPSAADLEQVVVQAQTDLAEAERAVTRAEEKLEADRFRAMATGDEAAVARLRRNIRQAKERRDDARDDLAAAERQVAAQRAIEVQKTLAEQLVQARSLGLQWQAIVAEEQELVRQLAEKHLQCLAAGQAFQASLPQPLKPEGYLWADDLFSRHVALWLYGVSGGKFGGRGLLSNPYEIANGPTLVARCRENVQRALSQQPKPVDLDLPPAA